MTGPRKERGWAGDLSALFSELLSAGTIPAEGEITALPIPGFESHRLGIDRDEAVCLLIAAQPSEPIQPDVRLANLRVRRRVVCDIARPTGERESVSGVLVVCRTESLDLRRFFLQVFGQALHTLGKSPREQDLDRWIGQATRLFSELETVGAQDIKGLWGELLLICAATAPEMLVRRWHEAPEDRYDFFAGAFALEVKTCSDLDRVHSFSLEQIRPASEVEVVVASIPVQEDPHGVSVIQLLSEAEHRIQSPELLDKLRRVAFRIGGQSLAQVQQRFDRREAARGIRFLRASSIPAIDESPPPEVLAVHLQVRCRDIPAEDLGGYIESQLGTNEA